MYNRRYSPLTVGFVLTVTLIHLLLFWLILSHIWNINDDASTRSRLREMAERKLQTGVFEASRVASVFDRRIGWTVFERATTSSTTTTTQTPTLLTISTTEATTTTPETIFELARDEDYEIEEEKILENDDDDDDTDEDEDEDEDDGDYADWSIELTSPGTQYPIISTLPKQTTTMSPSTLPPSTSTTTTTIPSFVHRHYEDNVALPQIHVTQSLLRKLQSPEISHPHRHHEHTHHHQRQPNTRTTIVTALLDIGRGEWPTYARPLSRYHFFMRKVLLLKVPLVAFVDHHSYDFVVEERRKAGLSDITKVLKIALEDLPMHRHLDVLRAIIYNEQHGSGWQADWEVAMKTHPEARSPEYDLVVNSKPYFVYNASIENWFASEAFVWLDAGYGQGLDSYFPQNFEWHPIFPARQISIAKVTPPFDDIRRYSLRELYRQDIAVISGGFFAGDREAIDRLYHLYNGKLLELMFRHRIVDDDQEASLWSLVNNAGFLAVYGPMDWIGVEEYEQSISVNLVGAIRMSKKFTSLIKQSHGRIVTMISASGRCHGFYTAPYVAAKFGLEGYVDNLRLELKPFGVKVVTLEPGAFRTNIMSPEAMIQRVESVWSKLTPEAQDEYGIAFKDNYIHSFNNGASLVASRNIDVVADAYVHAIFGEHPRIRYVCGWDAKFILIPLSFMPSAVQDALIQAMMNITSGYSKPAVLENNNHLKINLNAGKPVAAAS